MKGNIQPMIISGIKLTSSNESPEILCNKVKTSPNNEAEISSILYDLSNSISFVGFFMIPPLTSISRLARNFFSPLKYCASFIGSSLIF